MSRRGYQSGRALSGSPTRGNLIWLGSAALICVALVLAVLSSDPERTWLPAAAIVAPLFLLWLARRRLQPAAFSPVWIIALVLAAIGVFGYFLSGDLAGIKGGSIVLDLSHEDILRTAYIIAISVASFVSGATLVLLFRKPKARMRFQPVVASRAARNWMLVIAIAPVILVAGTLGDSLFRRTLYIANDESLGPLFGIALQLSSAAVAIVGYVLVAGTPAQRFVAWVLVFVYSFMLLSLGSRRLALMPIVFVLGMLMAKPTRAWLKLGIGALVAAFLLPIPLFLRYLPLHGLFPYVEALGRYDAGAVDPWTTLNNVLIAFPITGMTALHRPELPLEVLAAALNPIPGSLSGWYDVNATLMLNTFTPYSTLGELWLYGLGATIAVWMAFGFAAALLDGKANDLWQRGLPLFSLAITGLSALFAIQVLQYGLRLSSRMLLYAVIIAVVGHVYSRHRAKQPAAPRYSKSARSTA